MNNNSNSICTRCGSPLIQSEKNVRQSGNPLYPITITKYRCTDDSCQMESDKKQAELMQQRLEREERSKAKHQAKKI
jgi:hypothetical protein